MKRLDRYILGQIAFVFLWAVIVVSFLAAANEIRERLDEVPAELLTLSDILLLTVFFLPGLISYVLPVTFLIGILMAFSRMAQNKELVAIKAGGTSLKRVIAPVLAIAVMLSGVAFFIQEKVQPWSVDRAYDLMYRDLPRRATLDTLPAGVMHAYEGLRIYFQSHDQNGVFHGLDLVQTTEEGNMVVFRAESARIESNGDGYVLVLDEVNLLDLLNPQGSVSSETMRVPIPAPSTVDKSSSYERLTKGIQGVLDNERYWEDRLREAEQKLNAFRSREERGAGSEIAQPYDAAGETLASAAAAEREVERAKSRIRKERTEAADRLSMPFATLAFALVAAPLGVRARQHARAFTFAGGFSVLLLFYVVQTALEPRVLVPLWETIARAWTPNLVLIVVGLVLLRRVDSV